MHNSLKSLDTLTTLLREIDTLKAEFNSVEPTLRQKDTGSHVLGVEDLLQRHHIIEVRYLTYAYCKLLRRCPANSHSRLVQAQLAGQGDLLTKIRAQCHEYVKANGRNFEMLQARLAEVVNTFERCDLVACSTRFVL